MNGGQSGQQQSSQPLKPTPAKQVLLRVDDFTKFRVSDRALWHWRQCAGGDGGESLSLHTQRGDDTEANITTWLFAGEQTDGIEVLNAVSSCDLEDLVPANSGPPSGSMATRDVPMTVKKGWVPKMGSKSSNPILPVSDGRGGSSNTSSTFGKDLVVNFDSKVAFLYRQYRVAFAIDYSPSMRRIETTSGKPFYELLRAKVAAFVRILVKPIIFSGSVYTPEISLSVVIAGGECSVQKEIETKNTPSSSTTSGGANGVKGSTSHRRSASDISPLPTPHGELKGSEMFDNVAIVQDYRLTTNNVDAFLLEIDERLKAAESNITNSSVDAGFTNRHKMAPSLGSSSNTRTNRKTTASVFANILEASVDAVERLKPDACPLVILFTDGVIEFPMAHEYDALLMNMSRKDIPCHIVRIGTNDAPHSSWGCVSDPGSLQYIAHSTGGVFFEDEPSTFLPNIRGNVAFDMVHMPIPGEKAKEGPLDILMHSVTAGWHQGAVLFRYSCLGNGPHRSKGIAKSPNKTGVSTPSGTGGTGENSIKGLPKPSRQLIKPGSDGLLQSPTNLTSNSLAMGVDVTGPASNQSSLNLDSNLMMEGSWYQQYPIVSDLNLVRIMQAIDYPFPWYGPPPPAPRCKETVKQYALIVNIERLLECRAWEGFSASSIGVHDSYDTSRGFKLSLSMPWQPGIDVFYSISSEESRYSTSASRRELGGSVVGSGMSATSTVHVLVHVELIAGVEFLRNYRSQSKNEGKRKASRLHRFLSTLHEVDKVLVHLSSPPSMKDLNTLSSHDIIGANMLSTSRHSTRSASSKSRKDKSKNSSAFFSILGKLPLGMWGRWFCVEQVVAFVVGTTVFPKRQAKNLANILARWSTQRLSRDVHMKLLEVDEDDSDDDDESSEGLITPENSGDGSPASNRNRFVGMRVRALSSVEEEDGNSAEIYKNSSLLHGDRKALSSAVNRREGMLQSSSSKRSRAPTGVSFCLTKCKWKDPPTGVVVNIAFHAVKPSTRIAICEHLSQCIAEGGFLIVSPYEQNVALSVYSHLLGEGEQEHFKRHVSVERASRAIRACVESSVEIVTDVAEMDTEKLFRKVVEGIFAPVCAGEMENTYFLEARAFLEHYTKNNQGGESRETDYDGESLSFSSLSEITDPPDVDPEKKKFFVLTPLFMRVSFHGNGSRIRLKCYTRPFDQDEAKPLIDAVVKMMKVELNASVAEEILVNMIQISPITEIIVKRVSEHLDRLPKSRVATRDHAMSLGKDPVFVQAILEHGKWEQVDSNTFKRSNIDYWVLLSILDDDNAAIRVYGCEEKEKVLEMVVEEVDLASRIAEQAKALSTLFENRMCVAEKILTADCEPGSHACDIVYSVSFALHERVQANVALRALAAIPVLQPFAIINRANCYVLSKKHYAKLGTGVPAIKSQTHLPEGSKVPEDSSTTALNPPNKHGLRCLTMEVFGISYPGKEITVGLSELIRKKLQSVALGILLRNNPRSLSAADLAIIQPPGSSPIHKFDIRLPTPLVDTKLFSSIFALNSRRLLVPLEIAKRQGKDDRDEIEESRDVSLDVQSERDKSLVNIEQNAFLANGGNVTTSSLAIGRGVAVVYFDIYLPESVDLSTSRDDFCDGIKDDTKSKRNSWSLPPWHQGENGSYSTLKMQIWSAGSLNLEKFVSLLEQFVEQSIFSYALEQDFLLRMNGPSDLMILEKARLAGTPELKQVEASRIVPSWALQTVVDGIVSLLDGKVVCDLRCPSHSDSSISTRMVTIIRQEKGQLLEALATVGSRGVSVWTYKYKPRKNIKHVVDKLMLSVKANKRVVDRCLMAKMGLMESPIVSPAALLSKQVLEDKHKLEPIAGMHELILIEEAKIKVAKQRLERATLAVRQTCINDRRRVGNLPDLGQVLNASRVVKVMRTPLSLTTDITGAAKLYAKYLTTKLGLRRLRNKGEGEVLYGSLPDFILFVVRGRGNVLGIDVLVLPGSAAPGRACSRAISMLSLEAYAYDMTLKRVYGVNSGLAVRGAAEISEGLDDLLSRYPSGPPTGATNYVQRHAVKLHASLLDFLCERGDKYGCRGHANGAIDFILSSEIEGENMIAGIVRRLKPGETFVAPREPVFVGVPNRDLVNIEDDRPEVNMFEAIKTSTLGGENEKNSLENSTDFDTVYLYVLVRNLGEDTEGSSSIYSAVVERCLRFMDHILLQAGADQRRDQLWKSAMAGEKLDAEETKVLNVGAVEVCAIDPGLKELLIMTNAMEQRSQDEFESNFVWRGVENALIHTSSEGKAYLWRRYGPKGGKLDKEEVSLLELWVTYNCQNVFNRVLK
jgi:hypothetical protein